MGKMGYPVALKLIEYRSTCNQINTFIGEESGSALLGVQTWGRGMNTIHPTYSVMLANSHRNKCSSPNLQQVPKKTVTAKDFRRIFIPLSKKYYMGVGGLRWLPAAYRCDPF